MKTYTEVRLEVGYTCKYEHLTGGVSVVNQRSLRIMIKSLNIQCCVQGGKWD